MNTLRTCGALSALLLAVGCAGTPAYVYSPEAANTQTSQGFPAERTAIPQEAPQGAVEVASYGVTEINPQGTRIPALHVRMVVTNDGDAVPWHVDTSKQMAEIPGEGRSRALFVNSDVREQPIVTIGQHERHVMDFYFPLPETVRADSTLPRFDMLWQVDTPARQVASRTVFDREAEPADQVAYAGYDSAWPLWAGYGPYWWYDPFYPGVGFIHARPFAFDHFRGHVGVGRFGGHFRAGGRGGHVAGRR